MREILIDLSADETAAQYRFAGFEGEHNATKLTVILPKRLLGKEGAEYRFLFETATSEAVFSAPISLEGDSLSVKLTKQLMCAPILKVFVGCYVLWEGELILAAKSSEILLGIQKSVSEGMGEVSADGGNVPGLIIEDSVINSKNPVSSAAVLEALGKKSDRFELGSTLPAPENASARKPVSEKAVADALKNGLAQKIGREELSPALPDFENASDKKPASEKAVADALANGLAQKISREELSPTLPDFENASDKKPASEKAVADALLPYLKKEEYVADPFLSATGKNPVTGEAISQRVAPAFQKKILGFAALLDDVSDIEQRVFFETKEQVDHLERGELVSISEYAAEYVEVTEETYLKIRTVEEDKITFYDGEVWENYGQLSGSREGVLSEYFSPEDYACIVPDGENYCLYKALQTTAEKPVANAKLYQYGKNLCPIAEWEDFGPDRITSPIYWQNPPEGTYTFSAIVTKYPEDTSTNTRIKIAVYYTDGTSKAEMGDMDTESEESDGIPRFKKHTFTTEKGKTPKYFIIDPLDYSTRNVAKRKAEKVQLEYSPFPTEFEAYQEPKEIVSDAQGKGEILLQGENTTLYTLGNIIFSAEYNRDTGKVISRLEKAILDLGGNI